ncbi:MAG TPA: hypothetical protein VMA72_27395 [Streptosporangiaceae bacterium]|nr:hypothetical protein [Streptosporangiaceae bacterium]
MTRITVNDAVCEALFASPLQPSDNLTAETVADAIGCTVRRLSPAGCASQMAQEFGDHPEAATDRMRWVRQLTGDLGGYVYFPAAVSSVTKAVASDLLPVREAA